MRPDSLDDDHLESVLNLRERDQLRRHRRVVRPIDSVHVEIDGVAYVNFSSNNYLGLTHHPRVIEAVRAAAAAFGVGAAASPLITGHTAAHAAAEAALAAWKGTESALLLPSGYQANHAAVQTIVAVAEASGKAARFLVDRLAHASLIDAVRDSARSRLRVFHHNDLDKLQRLLERRNDDDNDARNHENDAASDHFDVVVTESIFSMDGDAAPLRELAALKRKHPFFLLLDEAHGSGVYGAAGAGYAAELGVGDAVDASIVTLSKALGCGGGAICGSQKFCDAVVNFGRAYIYSTSVPTSVAAAGEAAIGVMAREPQRQARVRALATRVRASLAAAGLMVAAGDSPIIPIVFGSEQAALAAAAELDEAELLVLAVRPPTVPRGTSRLRVTLSSEHSDGEVNYLIDRLARAARHGR